MKLTRKKPFVNIPMNAMSDVAFLLLIFIMLVSLINYRKEVKVDYPEAEKIGKVNEDKNLEIWIDKAGRFYLDGSPASLEIIESVVANVYTTAPDTRIHVIADKNTQFANVNNILQILQLLEYRVVSFVAR
jgi:biopolymer transport protein ExbD